MLNEGHEQKVERNLKNKFKEEPSPCYLYHYILCEMQGMGINMEEKSNKRLFGSYGEKIALEYLKSNDYNILKQNYRVGRMGEIDIIAQDGEYICFVEVKTRSNDAFGAPSESVTQKKQKQIIWMAKIYLKNNGLYNSFVRFDVIEVIVSPKDGMLVTESINLIKNAFIS